MIQYGPMKPQILQIIQALDKAKEPCLRIDVDGKFEHGYQGEGSIQKAVDEIVYWVDDYTVIEFFIDDLKYELPNILRHNFWGVFEGIEELKECIEYCVDFHKTFYYVEEKKEKRTPIENNSERPC